MRNARRPPKPMPQMQMPYRAWPVLLHGFVGPFLFDSEKSEAVMDMDMPVVMENASGESALPKIARRCQAIGPLGGLQP